MRPGCRVWKEPTLPTARVEIMCTSSLEPSDRDDSFGTRLRHERERRQIALASIAENSKISVSLLEDLERDDVSRWPSGIFGYLRGRYSAAGQYPRGLPLCAGRRSERTPWWDQSVAANPHARRFTAFGAPPLGFWTRHHRRPQSTTRPELERVIAALPHARSCHRLTAFFRYIASSAARSRSSGSRRSDSLTAIPILAVSASARPST